jgi:transposase-like protein
VWLYHRFTLSFQDIEEGQAAKGFTVSYDLVFDFCQSVGLEICLADIGMPNPTGE